MPDKINILLTFLLMLAVSPLWAQVDDEELELVPLPTELRLSGMAKVVTNMGRPAECLSPVAITRIDGEQKAVSAKRFLIEPGVHSLNGRAMLDTTNCPISDVRFKMNPAADLEVNFELGFTYYIAYYHQPANPEEWRLVVWNIETNP